GDAAPQEKRQARRQIHIANQVGGARPNAGGIALHTVEERRARQHSGQAGADARVKCVAVLTSLPVEAERSLHVITANRPPVRTARQVGEYALRTRRVLGCRSGPAHEDAVAAGPGADARDIGWS